MENQTGGDLVVKEIYLSIVIPAYNEEDNIQVLYEKLSFECKKMDQDYEIIFVDDGSDDRTFKLLCELQLQDSSVKVIKLSRNHGHQLALSAGIDNASGKYTITMDSDLQHPPEMIPSFIEEAKKGFDIIDNMGIIGKLDTKTKPLALLTGRRMKSRGLVYIYPMPRAMEKTEHSMCINDRSGSISPRMVI